MSFPLDEKEQELDLSVSVPGGKLAFTKITNMSTQMAVPGMDAVRNWEISMEGRMEDPERTLIMAQMDAVMLPSEEENEPAMSASYTSIFGQDGEYQVQTGFSLSAASMAESAPAGTLSGLVWRWDHPFSISMTVEEEPRWETFQVHTGEGSISVTPKQKNTGTVLSISTFRTEGDASCQILPGLTMAQLPVSCAQENLTLTGTDGTVYEGTYSPGRDDTYSEWEFGSLPEGDYILHVPYLYLRDSVPRSVEISLPQSGTLPGPGKTAMYGGWLELYEIACSPPTEAVSSGTESALDSGTEGAAYEGLEGAAQTQQGPSLPLLFRTEPFRMWNRKNAWKRI